ncbi:saccharopine dehydrogenase-like oxidoreductase [Methylophaga frappieri]|uniref:Saccharopine dehydrogenase-like oxidoreductase n=1 Tax=Methylophaga frappieri (strain ATCC BAA-2434 / DSM 25690 / JAM7) TaxID=754477 RepID=I1YF80_METFJ|nr:saccharopine dehydrogenase NADP-binding domain-containing protein [Methylophaga frappieri]AFJ01573.1 saccharopine dehydrogenase-like oxidoreductase [Methylophaga frappieri]
MKSFNKKVIVIGGSGETGKRIVSQLSKTYPDLIIASAARRQQQKAELPENIQAIVLDINDKKSAVTTIANYDLAIIALGPMDQFGNTPHQLCIEAGVDAIDINDSLDAADKILSLHEQAENHGRGLFTGMGFTPGLSTLLLMQLASEQASEKGIYRVRLHMGAAYGGGETSPYAMLASFRNKIDCYRGRQRFTNKTPWKDKHSQFLFPGQSKKAALIPFATPEIAGLSDSRTAEKVLITELDSRYQIQYLNQGFARMLARCNLKPGAVDYLAKKFYTSGQSMKHKKDADPDTTLWVYPDQQPEKGLIVHGVVSSYDLTALMACAVADCWLQGELSSYQGVFGTEHLPADIRDKFSNALTKRGITRRKATAENIDIADKHFGWVDSASPDIASLRNFGKNWYSFDKPHPKMAQLQKQFLLTSDIWQSLKQKQNSLGFTKFVIKTLLRWKKHNQLLAPYRENRESTNNSRWQAITKDVSMFTSGYSCAREVLGDKTAFSQYRKMFLETGKMEMRWLWPKPESFAAFSDPEQAIITYWLAFMSNYQQLGVFHLDVNQKHEYEWQLRISNCAYATMFHDLDCAELSGLVREMEREALHFITHQSNIKVTWLTGARGAAEITLSYPGHQEQQPSQTAALSG